MADLAVPPGMARGIDAPRIAGARHGDGVSGRPSVTDKPLASRALG